MFCSEELFHKDRRKDCPHNKAQWRKKLVDKDRQLSLTSESLYIHLRIVEGRVPTIKSENNTLTEQGDINQNEAARETPRIQPHYRASSFAASRDRRRRRDVARFCVVLRAL
jgi:hypothetical protein